MKKVCRILNLSVLMIHKYVTEYMHMPFILRDALFCHDSHVKVSEVHEIWDTMLMLEASHVVRQF